MAKISNQTGRVLDAISAGPIEGLLRGKQSVFFDDAALERSGFTDTTNAETETIDTIVSCSQGSNKFEVPKTAQLETLIGNLSAAFPRFLWVEGSGRRVACASYGGTEGYYSSNRYRTGGGKGKAILTYPFGGRFLDVSEDVRYQELFHEDKHVLFSREILDLHKYYGEGVFNKQSNNSMIKQTFTVNQFRTNWYLPINAQGPIQQGNYYGGNVFRRHFFKDISTYTYGDIEDPGTYPNAFSIGNNYQDVTRQKHLISITNGGDKGRIGLLGNTGFSPAYSGGAGGDYSTDFLLFDGVYKITSVQAHPTNPELLNIFVDTSTDPLSEVPRPPFRSKQNVRGHVFTTLGAGTEDVTTFRGDMQFRKGYREQEALTANEGGVTSPRTNIIINPNTTLLWSNRFQGTAKRKPDDAEAEAYTGTSAPTIYSSGGSSANSLGLSKLQTRQIDSIRLNVVFPNGLYAIEADGDHVNAFFDMSIKFRHRNSLDDEFTETIAPIKGTNKDPDWWTANGGTAAFSNGIGNANGGLIKDKKKSQFSREVTIDLQEFHPFIDFEIEVERQTPDNYDDYMLGSRINDTEDDDNEIKQFSGSATVQYVQALFHDRFTYPLTAYAASTFSGADFDRIPTRAYHCRGLLISVPSNYITREEDALLVGAGNGVARYTRVRADVQDITDREVSINDHVVLRNQFTFELLAGELDTPWQTAGPDVGYWTGREQAPGSTFAPSEIIPNPDNLIVSFYNSDPDQDDTLAHTANIRVRFQENYILYGSRVNLYKELAKATVVDLITRDTIIYDTIEGYADEDQPVPVVTLKQSNYSASNPAITAGRRYSVTLEFNGNIVRPTDYVVWDGTFREKVYCNNPAWVYYDILTNMEYGLGEFLGGGEIDIYELYEIARYCDELVPDGKGGLEPRFTCNAYLNKSTEAYQLVKDLASTFRGMSVWQNSQIIPIQDRPKPSIYLFTQANVIDGIFSYSRQSLRAMPNSIECTWNDPDQQFRQDVLILDDTENQLKVGRTITKKIVAFGCTSKGQAKRVAEWHLATNQRETKKVTFNTSINAALLRVGDIISIQDQHKRTRISNSGRLIDSPTPDVLVLDREVTLDFDVGSYLIFVQVVDSVFICKQRTAVINQVTYNLGDVIRTDKDGNLLTGSVRRGDEIVDDNNFSVQVDKTLRTSVIQKEILPTQTPTSNTIFLSSPIELLLYGEDNITEQEGLDETGTRESLLKEHIWAITRNDIVDSSIEKFRIMSIKPDADGFNTTISGIKYDESKFAKTDVNNSAFSDPFFNDTLATTVINAPENGTAALVAALKV